MKTLFIILSILFINSMETKHNDTEVILEDFAASNNLNWRIVNDGVMGGLSNSQMQILDSEQGQFSGKVSLDNNGGFASVRALVDQSKLPNTQKIILKVKGDGNRYSFRIRTDQYFDGVSYAADFETTKGQWITVELAYADFIPTFRGRRMRAPELQGAQIRQIGFLISDKQEGPFELLIDWIKAT